MKWPNLKHLHYLVVLHEVQHFNKAAQLCCVSQSTLSTAIQNLEEQFACQLLERDHKTFVFTPFGLELVERSKKLLNDATELVDFAQSAGNWLAGNLKLGVIPTIAPFIFEGVLGVVKSNFPELQLKLQEDTTENLLRQLNDGILDLLILALPMETPGCKQLVIGHDPFHLIAHSDLVSSLPEPMDMSALPKESVFLLQREHCMTGHAVSACRLQHSEQVSSLAASSLHTLVELANSKLGFTFMPELAIEHHILSTSQLVSMPAEDNAYREIGLVWRSGTTRVRLFRLLAELLSPLMPIPTLKK
ncbi:MULTISPECIES: hydrogen peroxide-inducible genes activator [Alteromonadaceae]|uniref:hydrogen peroxide-inducible genes activator n=1 Tax=Alteromonadaceae TaxID=72275 RepID=UPI001C08845A|nr:MULTISPECIES: hydrogen peroxide-inducible genes activator [Aliiglaciecola]MBU2876550.1 hydrogen peroxide-inducible genes activator [Aliiglaciecola lipolytica]MDO6711515.1 hydrogen peroxide-inducible genes activator [Aliiglaciecola sp. 2_MG-2023]MDO6752509.1 hydrogen peroxide-inducible genes activator [Aliiglaciecola sp. 1_MG-2023]